MAQGTTYLFDQFSLEIADGTHVLGTDQLKVALVTEQVGGTPTIAVDDATPNLAAYTQVPGGNGYTTGGENLSTVTWTRVAATASLKVTGGATVWSQNASGPTTIKTALLYNDDATSDEAFGFIDMTIDGTSAISLVAGDITINWQPTIFTLS